VGKKEKKTRKKNGKRRKKLTLCSWHQMVKKERKSGMGVLMAHKQGNTQK
jgi:hypothetical protein